MIFDGKELAREIEERVKSEILNLDRPPRIVSYLVGNDKSSHLYTRLKRKAAERVGAKFEIVEKAEDVSLEKLTRDVSLSSSSSEVDGVMVQLPLPDSLRGKTDEVLENISVKKDVDGLRWRESLVMPATVRAVFSILDAMPYDGRSIYDLKFTVVGSRGSVGQPLTYFLKEKGVDVCEVEIDTRNPEKIIRESQVIISCVGKPLLIKEGDVKEGVISIDVGVGVIDGKAVGDMEREVYQKSKIAVPVPGGVGPVTISCLLQNLVDIAASN